MVRKGSRQISVVYMGGDTDPYSDLTLFKEYNAIIIYQVDTMDGYIPIKYSITDNSGGDFFYNMDYFLTLADYREKKLTFLINE